MDALSTWTFLTPVFGVGIAAVVLGERPGNWTAAGLTAVLLAMLVALTPRHPGRVPASVTTTTAADHQGDPGDGSLVIDDE